MTTLNMARTVRATIAGGGVLMDDPMPFFTTADVARMFGQEHAIKYGKDPAEAKPLSKETITRYINDSKPDDPAHPRKRPGKYAARPIPTPRHVEGPRTPFIWRPKPGQTMADLERELRAWYHSRDGQGAGGGRPRKDGTRAGSTRIRTDKEG